jgi:hypothetical protein
MPTKLTPEIVNAAIVGFEQQKLHIDAQIAELRAMLSGGATQPTAAKLEPTKGKRRKMSAAARKRIGDAQRKRWAASKGEAELPSKTVTAKPKRKMSAAGRKAISEATKKRWAAFHKAKTKPVVVKKATAKKAAVKKAPVKAAKKTSPVKKSAAKKSGPKKTAPIAAQAGTETAAQ